MKLLYANDVAGCHAPSWYAATARPLPTGTTCTLQELTPAGDLDTDVAIIGGGYTGLGAAVALAKRGIAVTLFDAHRIGWGASGRNGGQLGSGFNKGQDTLATLVGEDRAHRLWDIAEAAKQTVHDWATEAGVDIDYRPGVAWAMHRARKVAPVHAYAAYLARHYDYTRIEALDATTLTRYVDSPAYHGGVIDHGAGHLDPLALARALALLANRHGARLVELAEVLELSAPAGGSDRWTLRLVDGRRVRAPRVVVACNGYVDRLLPRQGRYVMPINNFIVATEPLGEHLQALLPGTAAIADSRFVVNYFRRTADDRLLFGGGENYRYRFPPNIPALVRRALLQVFPSLHTARLDYGWGGTLAVTRSRLPWVRQPYPGLYAAAGYSGHGVGLAVQTGRAIGTVIADDDPASTGDSEFAALAAIPARPFPTIGGNVGRSLLLAAAMSGYSWLDRW